MEYRIERDSMGEVRVPADRYWGAQTQRSHENFPIGVGIETMPAEIIRAFAVLKKAAAIANRELLPARMSAEKCALIGRVCDEILAGELDGHFPLVVWQTGSGTQSNMNVNEVIANRGNELAGKKLLHPNDDVNMSQSSNDTFPTAMHIAACLAVEDRLLPAVSALEQTLLHLEAENADVLKSGRTHLQDATPITFAQEISGWRTSLARDRELLTAALPPLRELALGGTAVGTGLNAPDGFDRAVAAAAAELTGKPFVTASNKFHALTSRDELVFAHGAVKALACDMMKLANDVRWLASGPRTGLGEIAIPANEPGSSIMPGKINPVMTEVMILACHRVAGNQAGVGFGAFSGELDLGASSAVPIRSILNSIDILSRSMVLFADKCVKGLSANAEKCLHTAERSTSLATMVSALFGYKIGSRVANLAYEHNLTCREAAEREHLLSHEAADDLFDLLSLTDVKKTEALFAKYAGIRNV